MERIQMKLIHFLFLSLTLRNTFDIYKIISMLLLFMFWTLYWLVHKRSDFLISRESRAWSEHFRIMILLHLLILLSFTISYLFFKHYLTDQYISGPNALCKVYVIIGFECVIIFLDGLHHSFRYQLALVELYYEE